MTTTRTSNEPSAAPPTPFRNRLLAALPAAETAVLAPLLEPVELRRRQLCYDPDAPIEHVYFVEHGLASILSVVADGSAVETATIGHEGMIGMPVFHGVDWTSEQAMMQIPGNGHRVAAAAFRDALPSLPTLGALLHRFAAYSFTFAAQNSACNRKHTVEERLARWLLIAQDRTDSEDIGLTHDFVSQMLGVRRASVTDTLAGFELEKLIATGRNRISILDRPGIAGRACECYGILASAFDRLLSGVPTPSVLDGVETSRDGFSTVGDGTPKAASTDEPSRAD